MNYYNEIDKNAAAWLRELIRGGHIPFGIVDERSIEDVDPRGLRGFTQCHFFAGIGGWSYALRLAGWPDDRPVWTGSCPCQSFSTAGKQAGTADPRHLWPVWFKLIAACKPEFIFGEQVAAAIGHGWLDLIQADLAGENYSSGAVVLPACVIGAPHIRQRLWFGAHRLADTNDARPQGRLGVPECANEQPFRSGSVVDRLADATSNRRTGQGARGQVEEGREPQPGTDRQLSARPERPGTDSGADAPDGIWRTPDWLYCRDGKWRPVEPSTFPLAHGLPARVVRLRGYGNAIVPQVAAEIIKSYLEVI